MYTIYPSNLSYKFISCFADIRTMSGLLFATK